MPEIFRKGAHVMPLKISQGNRGESGKVTLKRPVGVGDCATQVNAWSIGDVFMVKPRGSPNIWKVYMLKGADYVQVFKHKDEDAALAYARLLYG